MKILAFNGSPRKNWNTATVLNHALEGVASQGAETELIHLYDLNYKGCISCFACKRIGGKSYGRCAINDGLMPILKKVEEADAIILAAPIYLGRVGGEMCSFIERLIFPYLVYDENYSTLFKKKIPTGFIYTLGSTENRMKLMGWNQSASYNEMLMNRICGIPIQGTNPSTARQSWPRSPRLRHALRGGLRLSGVHPPGGGGGRARRV
jgi:multimeric flavodoxin WrbA